MSYEDDYENDEKLQVLENGEPIEVTKLWYDLVHNQDGVTLYHSCGHEGLTLDISWLERMPEAYEKRRKTESTICKYCTEEVRVCAECIHYNKLGANYGSCAEMSTPTIDIDNQMDAVTNARDLSIVTSDNNLIAVNKITYELALYVNQWYTCNHWKYNEKATNKPREESNGNG